ncbi:MAG: hypothetical protein B9S38_08885 [Verrucomicrobiia bacterium Tous-C4TDCM]|nr:MAG: hypothetical protein B9S38_08885 [Verrucomicrobiae bacterium Tous-C4TDCM]
MHSKFLLQTAIAVFLGLAAMAEDPPAEILIHEGPVFTTPGLEPNEEITFTKEFPVDAAALKRQPFLSLTDKLPLSPEKAIELAKASADAGDPPGEKNVVRLELLPFKRAQNGNTLCYLIELNVDGNEVHRVVLMDGTVVKSRLRQLRGK